MGTNFVAKLKKSKIFIQHSVFRYYFLFIPRLSRGNFLCFLSLFKKNNQQKKNFIENFK